MDTEPEVGSEPLQAPLAVQEVALAEFQVMVEGWPAETLDGEALKLIVGADVGGAAGP